VYDSEGRFVPQNFENLFSKYDKTGTGSLSSDLQPVAANPARTLTLNGGDEEPDCAFARLSFLAGWTR